LSPNGAWVRTYNGLGNRCLDLRWFLSSAMTRRHVLTSLPFVVFRDRRQVRFR